MLASLVSSTGAPLFGVLSAYVGGEGERIKARIKMGFGYA